MKNINYTLWKQYMIFPSTMDYMKLGYLVRKILSHQSFVYTIIGKDGFTYIITPITGGHKVAVLYNNNMILQFIDVILTSQLIFTRYIYTDTPGDYTIIHYNNKTCNLLTSTKYNTPFGLDTTPTPSKFLIDFYQTL